ncbi:MAG: DUF2911 domain-containing protein [Opitutaceae bacterium]
MNHLSLTPILGLLAFSALSLGAQTAPPPAPVESLSKPARVDFPQPSPNGIVKQRVGRTDIEIVYGRPSVRGRPIFGSLVPFGQVWRTGANQATKVSFSTAVTLNGVAVPAGVYELFTVPDVTSWTVIVHKAMSQWGAYKYDAKNDVVRFQATPLPLATPVETFTLQIGDLRDTSATLSLLWDRTQVPVRIEVDLVPSVVAEIKAALEAPGPKTAGLYFGAAQFYHEHRLDDSQALQWVDEAARLNPKAPYMMLLKARLHQRLNQPAEARKAAQASIELGLAAEGPTSSIAVQARLLLTALPQPVPSP